MNSKIIVEKIFVNIVVFLKDGIKLWLDYHQKSYERLKL